MAVSAERKGFVLRKRFVGINSLESIDERGRRRLIWFRN